MPAVPRLRRLSFALLVALLVVTSVARSDNPPSAADKAKQIAEIEKQIADLKAKLEAAKAAPVATAEPAGPIPAAAMAAMPWRNIGPANMGGRITALAVYEADPSIYFVATASGGLLKTVNNGITFEHQFDKEATVSIGDVAVSQSDSNIVWVGTGEANPRNSASYGDGVYKSTDGGTKWTNMGLKGTFQIGKILIHPKNPDTVYVGALGRLYGASEDRGIFKTTDGGKTWKKVLYVDDKTGVIDAMMDPKDPETIVAALWERKRDEFDGFFGDPPVPDAYGPVVTHGAGGGLHKTTDGGKTWAKVTTGLPTAKNGRIGLDVSRTTKGRIVAIIDTEKVGTGDPPRQVFMGIVGENVEASRGAKLTEITKDGPAAKGGVKVNDIVVKVDDKPIADYDSLVELIRTKKAGDVVKLTVKRDGKEEAVSVTLADRPLLQTPARGGPGPARTTPPRPTLGFSFAKDMVVGSVLAGSGAEKAGLKVDDIVTAVAGKPVKNLEEYLEIVGPDRKAGDTIKLAVTRGKETKELDVVFGAPAGNVTATLMPGFAPAIDFRATEVKVGIVVKDSPAEKAGIKIGDLIVEVDGKPVDSYRAFVTALRTSGREDNPRKAGDKVRFKIKQGEKSIDAELPLALMDLPGTGGGGPPRNATAARPYALGLGGQQPNAMNQQGKEGWNTGGIYQSDDFGTTWKRINSLNPRPMYFSVIRVDPTDDKTIYVLGDIPAPLWVSSDGGATFKNMTTARNVHPDAHAMWIDPKNRKHLIVGCDGGFYVSYDAGVKWDHLNNFALGQFYHVAVDNRTPYRVYGGLQDNGSWGGPSLTQRSYGPVNEDWLFVSGGDGFVCRVDPNDPDLIYTESQGGAIRRQNLRTGDQGFLQPPVRQGEPNHRFNWNTPFLLSNHNPGIFYSAGEYVWRSVKKGAGIRKISPDITRTPAGSATALSESPVNPDILWVGTDDGFVWVSKDGGLNWVNVTDAIKAAGLPGYRAVATLEASRERDPRCYVSFDAHRSNDDKPYLFSTDDFGKTWKPIVGNLPAVGSTRCLREDRENTELLYCGTEFGAWASANRGQTWTKLGAGLPTVAVHEFAQPTTCGDLVVATHGRSIWVMDATTVRQMKADLAGKTTLFSPAPVIRWRTGVGGESPYSSTDRKFVGSNPPTVGFIDYALGKPAAEVSLKIVDVNGKTVRSFTKVAKDAGFHRVEWDLLSGSAPARGGRGNAPAASGIYRVVLTVDGTEQSQPFRIDRDPTLPKDAVNIDGEDDIFTPENPLKAKRVPAWVDD